MLTQYCKEYNSIKTLISPEAREFFYRFSELAPEKYTSSLDDMSLKLFEQCRYWIKPDINHEPARVAKIIFDNRYLHVSSLERVTLKISLIAKLALKTPHHAES